jgi:hypothetical protein
MEQHVNINGSVKHRWTQELKSLMDDVVHYLGGGGLCVAAGSLNSAAEQVM